MDTKNRRRKPVLIAAVVVAGVAVTVNSVAPSTSASSATAAAAAKVTAGAPGRSASGDPKVSLVVSTAAPANTGRDIKMCAAAHGKYQGTVVRTVPVMGEMGTAKGRRGGTVIVMRSTVCGTAWAQVKKDGKYDKRAYPTSVWIATYATEATEHSKLGENYREAATRAVLSTRAVPAGGHGTLEVEARWAGKGLAFYNAVPIVY
ncbi:hypothetical protein [Actinoallomurus sp. CA-150999]|uniref:hypothetical protein n=1 Tax=Actinoallomurus sp. CA-150999 TaxID=3239887 RepID=UPI003D9004F7